MLSSFLKKHGFDTLITLTGKDALTFFNKDNFDIILTDIMLPDITSDRVISTIKKSDKNALIIVMSDTDSKDSVIHLLKLGAIDCICKPVNPDILVNKINVFLELQMHRKTLEASIDETKTSLALKDKLLFKTDAIYRNVFDNISVGISLINSEMQVIDINQKMKEWNFEFKLETSPHCFEVYNYPPKKTICENCPVVKCFQDGNTHEEIMLKNTKKGTFYFKITACPIKDETGRITNVIELLEDVTEQEKKKAELEEHLNEVKSKLKTTLRESLDQMVGISPKMQNVYKQIEQFAETDLTILIQGETGTGKELAALAIHNLSHRKKERFIPVQCGALPETLLESNLFGYVKGAFTGAITEKPGLLECGNKGTIFLDEIELASDKMQSALLRVLENKDFFPIGSTIPKKIDVKIIVACNENLEKMVSENKFREDLYYRITGGIILLPPLKERKEDIPILANSFFSQVKKQNNNTFSFSPKSLHLLQKYNWPGNIRELKNLVFSLSATSQNSLIRAVDLPDKIKNYEEINLPLLSFAEQEKQLLQKALDYTLNNKTEAARILGIARKTIYELIKKHKL